MVEGEEDFVNNAVWAGGARYEAEVLGRRAGGEECVFVEGFEVAHVAPFHFILVSYIENTATRNVPPTIVGTQFTVGASLCL